MVTKAEIGNAGGFSHELEVYEGVVLYKANIKNILGLPSFPVKEDDIFLCTYPRSGTHVTWEIISMIVAGKAEYAQHWMQSASLEARTRDHLEYLESPRVMFTHLRPHLLPKEIWEKKCRVVNVQRNPKDVIVSRYNQKLNEKGTIFSDTGPGFVGTWDQFLDHLITGCAPRGAILDYVYMVAFNAFPQEHPDVPFYQLQYEDIKKNPVQIVRNLADFLGCHLEEDLCEQIADACAFRKLSVAYDNEKDQTFKSSTTFFRKGQTGDWKNWFTVAQSERFDKHYLEKFNHPFPF